MPNDVLNCINGDLFIFNDKNILMLSNVKEYSENIIICKITKVVAGK